MNKSISWIGIVTISLSILLTHNPIFKMKRAYSENVTPTIEIIHKPVETVQSGKRISLTTEVADPEGIKTVRVYFKTASSQNYNFVVLEQVENVKKSVFEQFKRLGSNFEGLAFSGLLPATIKGTTSIDYLIVVQNNASVVVKSQIYNISITPGAESPKSNNDPIQVYSELDTAPTEIDGFSDNITIDVVESTGKLGGTAMLYGALSGGSEGAAVAGGTVVATSGGFTATAVAVTAGVVVAGGAVAASGGGGGGGDSSASTSSSNTSSACPYQGNWRGTWSQTSCNNISSSGPWTGSVNSNCYFSGGDSDGQLSGSINPSTGAASLSGGHVCGPISGTGTFSGNSTNGNFGGSGVSGTFSGSR